MRERDRRARLDRAVARETLEKHAHQDSNLGPPD
jgi:hypothetical protein